MKINKAKRKLWKKKRSIQKHKAVTRKQVFFG